jgi:hypothetical protein
LPDPYTMALERLDAFLEAAQREADKVAASDLAEWFPDTVTRAKAVVGAVREARRVADPEYLAWVVTAKRGKAHAVRDLSALLSLCGRSVVGGRQVPEAEADRCVRCHERSRYEGGAA